MFIDSKKGGREIERERARERERSFNQRETLISCPPHVPGPGTEPTTQVCALTRDPALSTLVHGMMLQPTKPPGQGSCYFLRSITV